MMLIDQGMMLAVMVGVAVCSALMTAALLGRKR